MAGITSTAGAREQARGKAAEQTAPKTGVGMGSLSVQADKRLGGLCLMPWPLRALCHVETHVVLILLICACNLAMAKCVFSWS